MNRKLSPPDLALRTKLGVVLVGGKLNIEKLGRVYHTAAPPEK